MQPSPRLRFALLFAVWASGLECFADAARAQDVAAIPAGRRYALLVGVDKYPRSGLLASLSFPERDVEELARVLLDAGYAEHDVRVLTRSRGFQSDLAFHPIAANIRHELRLLLADKQPHDTLLIVLSGHGVLMPVERFVAGRTVIREESFFCPADADLRDKRQETFISLEQLYEQLSDCPARVKFLLCDACRNQAFAGGKPGGIHLPPPTPPPQTVAAIYACSKEEVAYEDAELDGGHGVFMHFVIRGLQGEADLNADSRITSFELAEYCGRQVADHVRRRFGNRQTPELTGSLQSVTLARISPASASPPPMLQAPFTAEQAQAAQQAWARRLGRPVIETNSLGMKFSLIPPGQYLMGSSAAEAISNQQLMPPGIHHDGADEQPARLVRITRPFYLAQHETTVGQLRQYVQATERRTESQADLQGGWGFNSSSGQLERGVRFDFQNAGWPQDDRYPAVNVSYHDATAFARWLGNREGRSYSLPTEAQWEYACRAGTTSRYFAGNEVEQLVQTGNLADAAAKRIFPAWPTRASSDGYAFTAPVGSFRANAFGLHDMHGNVWEWCRDWYDPRYYAAAPSDDPNGPTSGEEAVLRGGSWIFIGYNARSAFRGRSRPSDFGSDVGFRLVLTP